LFLDFAVQRERVEENLQRFAAEVMKPLQTVSAVNGGVLTNATQEKGL
jgi:hypothetical protein